MNLDSNPQKDKLIKYLIGGIIILFLLIILWPFKIVETGEKGLVFNLGAIQDKILDNGIHWRTPIITKIKTVSIRPIQLDYRVEVGADGAITKDNQTIGADMSIFYTYKEDQLVQMWKQYGIDKIQNILQTTLKESFKVAIGAKTIFNIAEDQKTIQSAVLEDMKNKMKDYPITITELKLVNYDWSDQFDAQIAETMNRAQKVKQAEQELLITEQTANKQVKEAESAKNALITKAEGEKAAAQLLAEAKALEGEGIRKYNQAVQANMELEIQIRKLEIEKIKAEKWNGQYVANNNYGPIPVSTGNLMPNN